MDVVGWMLRSLENRRRVLADAPGAACGMPQRAQARFVGQAVLSRKGAAARRTKLPGDRPRIIIG
ncbi:hypothetical protein [Caballeronia sp. AZ10_KS36]|uniref:hypothetical protein n=1 Tax=Caballeronia sp. AZ10_KS36 TaxID=2921757 RepID=UPI0020279DB9|nr:hypothetical protein [Caballeronia sp. AZ10_KS36]